MHRLRRETEASITTETGVFMIDSYGDVVDDTETSNSIVKNSKPLKPANFYRSVSDNSIMLGLPIGEHNASPSSWSQCDVGDKESGSADISTTPYYSARIESLTELTRTKYDTALSVAFDIKTQLDVDDAELDHGDDKSDAVCALNREEFDRLKQHPEWGSFFNQYSNLKLGDLIAKGGQAKVYEATGLEVDVRDSTGGSRWSKRFVAKVFKKKFCLSDLKKFWPSGLVAAANAHRTRLLVPYVCWARGAQLLEDNRFAFVFPRLNCDLRQRIDDAMRKRNGKGPPFSPFACFCIISDIAAGMAYLHNRGMLHHDLKAANVLDLRNICEDQRCIMMLVADFESSEGILGTGFWRAPEILSELRARRKTNDCSKPVPFSKEADIYSFAITCYEVITGHRPFEGRLPTDYNDIIDHGERPKLHLDIYPELRDLICRCWSSDPLQRPSFDTIRTDLIQIGKLQSRAWNINIRFKTLDFFYESDYATEKKGVEDIDWEWPTYNQWRSSETGSIERKLQEKRKIKNIDWQYDAPFEVTYEQDGPIPDIVTIKLHSPHLIQVAKQCLPQLEQYFSIDEPEIDARDMFIALQSFKEAHQSIQQDENASANKLCHSKHLLRFLETHFKDTIAEVRRMRREMKVRFDLLWAFFYKGEKVYYTCSLTGHKLQGIVTLSFYEASAKKKHFVVNLECRDYNGWNYVTGLAKCVLVEESKNEKSFDSIGICPMRLLEQSRKAEMEAMFLCNGRKFYDIVAQGSTYMQYKGSRLLKEGDDFGFTHLKKQKADGRVMVDLLSFARTNPNYSLGNARPPTNRNPQNIVPYGNHEMPSDEELMLAPAVVYGFSFSNKQWGGFDSNGFSAIHFDDQVFDEDLVLTDPERKEMLLALVNQYVKDPSADDMLPQIDPISNKGDGCIFLCYGPQGTGKTLTAEAIAEKLHRPLWSVTAFELGVTAKDLEKNLMDTLDIASQWRAVLLLDEADLYLIEDGTSNADPNRTAMTAIFLRALDYYRGVLFLTTNRVASFDDAFCSRISIFLRYHRLSRVQRESIWRNLLSRAQVQNPDLTLLRDFKLNGREIRNSVQMAQALARSSGEELTTDHVLRVANMPVELRQDLLAAITEETDEPSICKIQAGSWRSRV